ncbi:hypothetical protein CSUB01_10074 [Colletotrichum sublineola]|uniref:Uncharacterized protein n=1 Tax=Colletotrichum sublineola TaxID=1173701 RepID=A0A066X0Q3_COLSU|nr:hypothetical protein CSUB01_10074 [Colletotrichum sublineola]
MAATSSAGKYRRNKGTNEVQDFGGSAKRQTIQLGQEANVFSAVIYYNLISRHLDGVVHVPRGQSIPDVNQFNIQMAGNPIFRITVADLLKEDGRQAPLDRTKFQWT